MSRLDLYIVLTLKALAAGGFLLIAVEAVQLIRPEWFS